MSGLGGVFERAKLLDSAIETMRDIASLAGTSKRQRHNSDIAKNWLLQHGIPLEAGGYVPGKGFTEESI